MTFRCGSSLSAAAGEASRVRGCGQRPSAEPFFPRQEVVMRSVFERQTDALQAFKGIATAVWIAGCLWGLVLLAFWWAAP